MHFVKIVLTHMIILLGMSFAQGIQGLWLTQNKEAKIEIYEKNDKIFGKIAWMKEPNERSGSPKLDTLNPIESLRNQTILGLELLRNFQQTKEGIWEEGKIYDPESGSDYSCKITLKSNDELKVRGYIGFSLLGRTETWTRVQP